MKDLQIIGDRIEFMGYHVGTLTDITPPTVQDAFKELLDPTGYRRYDYVETSRRKGKRK